MIRTMDENCWLHDEKPLGFLSLSHLHAEILSFSSVVISVQLFKPKKSFGADNEFKY